MRSEIENKGERNEKVGKATPEGPASLTEGLKANQSVQHLHAKSNGLRAAGATAFGKVLKTNKTLTVLDLSDNEMGG